MEIVESKLAGVKLVNQKCLEIIVVFHGKL